jgi:uncharacterized protein (TIGR02466 family)
MMTSDQKKNKNLFRAVDTRLSNKWCLSPIWLVETSLDSVFNQQLFKELLKFYKDIDQGLTTTCDLIHYNAASFNHLKNVILSSVGEAFAEFENISPPESTDQLPFEMCSAWITIMPPGENYVMHTHPNAILTGTYYISTPPNSGDIAFIDTQDLALDPVSGTAKIIRIPPKEGNLVFFPAYLLHEVQTNHSSEGRISITFDLKLKDSNLKDTDKKVARTIVENYERFVAKAQ